MSVLEVVPIAFSAVALLVALYGIVERQRAAYSAMRVRITELLSQAEALSVEEDRYWEALLGSEGGEEGPQGGYAQAAMGARRALLTYQALSLLQRLSRVRRGLYGDVSLTPNEHASLATLLMRAGDIASAKEQWQASLAPGATITSHVRAWNAVGFAGCHFELGEVDAARERFREAIAIYRAAGTRTGRDLAFATCLDWLAREKSASAAPELAVIAARAIIADAPPEWALPATSALRDAARNTACDPKSGRYYESGSAAVSGAP